MSNTQKIIGIAFLVFFVGVAVFTVLRWEQITHFVQTRIIDSPSHNIRIVDTTVSGAKVILKAYPFQEEVEQKTAVLQESNMLTVTITNNPADAKNKFKRKELLSSGFSYGGSDAQPNVYDIKLYISPEITEKQDREAELSRTYLTAVLTAEAYRKSPANPDYTGIPEFVLKIMNEAKQIRQYPIQLIE